jgi:hypothetical protein
MQQHLDPRKALCAGAIARRVGSVMIAPVACSPCASNARVPADAYSSSHTAVTMISLASAPRSAARAAATHIAAMPPFMSVVPRPNMLPSRTSGAKGACDMPSTPTTSRCPFKTSGVRPAGPMRATTLARPGVSSCNDTANPHAFSTAARCVAQASSPGPPGTSDGLRESIATSDAVSATGSSG